MTDVTHGMDVARVEEVARVLRTSAQQIDGVRQQGEQQADVLAVVWSGEDLEDFLERWHDALPALRRTGQSLLDMASQLVAQVGQQEDASGPGTGSPFAPGGPLNPFGEPTQPGPRSPFAPGGPLNPFGPADPFNPFGGDEDRGWRPPGWDTATGALDWLNAVMNNPWVKFPLIGLDGVDGTAPLRPTWTRGLFGDGPLVRFTSKFGKVLPILGVLSAEWESQEVREDLARGKANPADIWNKMLLGRGSAGAAYLPGPGTLISAALAMEQFRADTKDDFDRGVAEKTGLNENVVTALRLASSPGISLITEVMPDKDFNLPDIDLPRPSLPDLPKPNLPDMPKPNLPDMPDMPDDVPGIPGI